MKRLTTINAVLFVLAACLPGAAADLNGQSFDPIISNITISRTLSYQGILKNSTGNPVPDASYNIVFRIYGASSGGSALWSSALTPVTTAGGYFTTMLGPIPLPFNTTYYLSLQVGADPEMTQRQTLTMTPYSASADSANHSFAADTSSIARNVLDNSISSAKIVNGTILFNDIAQNGAVGGQVMKWNGSVWAAGNDSVGTNGGGDITAVNTNEGLTGGGASGDVTVGIATGGVTGVKLASNSIDSSKILNASIAFNDIGSNGAIPGQVIKWNGSAWVARNDSLGVSNSGWVDGGNFVSLSNSSDSVGIGTTAPTAKLQVEGTLKVADKANIGPSNTNNGTYAFVAGFQNNANGNFSTIGGGYTNTTAGIHSVIAGGFGNNAANNYSAVSGGLLNTGGGEYSSVGGGLQNSSNGLVGTISGGQQNTVSAYADFVGGGAFNTVNGLTSAICGGQQNLINADHGTIGGGIADTVIAVYGGVASGYSNLAGDAATDSGAFVGGGYNNSSIGFSTTVAGGYNNIASDYYATIGGGSSNAASGNMSTVGGGWSGIASGGFATIAGGRTSTASGTQSTISGGANGLASGFLSIVAGGQDNTAAGEGSAVSGGYLNNTAGNYSTILGGSYNTLTAAGSFDLVFGNTVYLANSYRVGFFDSANPGRLGINRDDFDGGVGYPIQVGANATNGNGAYLTAGGVWTNGSSRTFKENFTPFNGNELLSKISNLSITTYNYKNTTEKHVGPVAEEFVGAFDTGVIRESDGKRDDMYLSSGDVAGVALAGVQELIQQNKEMKSMIEELKAQVAELKKGK